MVGSFDGNDPECDVLARSCGLEVVSLGYPLAPEHPYPRALRAVASLLADPGFGGGRPLVLVGESSGGTLAAAVLQQSVQVRQRCAGLVLAYPLLDLTLSGPTVRRFARGYFLTADLLAWFVQQYLQQAEASADTASVSPLAGPVELLPPALGVTGEFDPLRSDLERLAERTGIRLIVVPGMLHGFLQMRRVSSQRAAALREIADFLTERAAAAPGLAAARTAAPGAAG